METKGAITGEGIVDILERRLLIEQTRKELLDEIKQYLVGFAKDGAVLVKGKSPEWNGFILVIPEDKYGEFLQEKE